MNLIPCLLQIINQRTKYLWLAIKLSMLVLLAGVSGCSLVVSGYNNAPKLLMYWWIDPHLDLNTDQYKQTLSDLQQIHRWHRQNQLAAYADLLHRMQQLAPNNVSAEQVCAVVDEIAEHMESLAFQFEEPISRLALSLTSVQLQTLRKKYAQDWKDYRKEWKLDGSTEAQLEVQTDKGESNAEKLYGRLSPAQKKLLRQLAQNSGYDGERTYAERVRLQQDNLGMHEAILKQRPDMAQAQIMVRNWLQNSLHTPDSSYAGYLKKRKQTNCEAAASLHNTTTADQRDKAQRVLKDYEDDVRTLMRQKPS